MSELPGSSIKAATDETFVFEDLGLLDVLFRVPGGAVVFYDRTSPLLQLIWKLLPVFRDHCRCSELSYGDLRHATGVMAGAYRNAQQALSGVKLKRFQSTGADLFGIDFTYILKHFLFTEVFCRTFEFIELALRYAGEHPEDRFVFYVSKKIAGRYRQRLRAAGRLRVRPDFTRIMFFLSAASSSLTLLWHRLRHNRKQSITFHGNIVCNLNGKDMHQYFLDLFGEDPSIRFTVTPAYARELEYDRMKSIRPVLLELTAGSYRELKRDVERFVRCCLNAIDEIGFCGERIIYLLSWVFRARGEAIYGRNNLFITFEHFDTERAIRNEFIRKEGSRSVFWSKNSYPMSRFHNRELFHNYDVLCSSGHHLEELHRYKKSKIPVILETGSYDSHRLLNGSSAYHKRIENLKSFKNGKPAVTFLTPGICDECYSHEVRLMKLAQKIGEKKLAKVFIRPKPVDPTLKYENFYSPFFRNRDNIFLTGADYDLFDFLEVTDLFITSLSSSACEILVRGGQVVFIDYMKTPDRYLFWEKFPEIILSENEAAEYVLNWLRDDPDGPVRTDLKKILSSLSEYLAYRFPDYDLYKKNLCEQLEKKVSKGSLKAKRA